MRKDASIIARSTRDRIRRYFYAEHWKGGVQPAPSMVDPYLDFIRQTLNQHPRLRQAQADWAHFGPLMAGRARRALSCKWRVNLVNDAAAKNFLAVSSRPPLPPRTPARQTHHF
ncbi:MAG: hypothetical protein ABSG56_22245 [Bryobacteraceae bacterium]